jgi:hypothetical protein
MSGIFLVATGVVFLLGWVVGKYEEQETGKGTTYNAVPGERVPISGAGGFVPGGGGGTSNTKNTQGAYDF